MAAIVNLIKGSVIIYLSPKVQGKSCKFFSLITESTTLNLDILHLKNKKDLKVENTLYILHVNVTNIRLMSEFIATSAGWPRLASSDKPC